MQQQIDYKKLDEHHLARVLDHAVAATRHSAQALREALDARVRRQPFPDPIWAYRLAHDANLDRLETILEERDRRYLP